MPPDAREALRWLEKADHDAAAARASLACAPPITDVAAFHCQQAVEKMLKAFLVYRGEPFEKTHDLVELLALCARHDDSFQTLRTGVEPLTPFAVRFRYPGPADPSVDAVESALRVVETARGFIVVRLPADVRMSQED